VPVPDELQRTGFLLQISDRIEFAEWPRGGCRSKDLDSLMRAQHSYGISPPTRARGGHSHVGQVARANLQRDASWRTTERTVIRIEGTSMARSLPPAGR